MSLGAVEAWALEWGSGGLCCEACLCGIFPAAAPFGWGQLGHWSGA